MTVTMNTNNNSQSIKTFPKKELVMGCGTANLTKRDDGEPKHWIFRVQDGANFRNSLHPFWGVKRGKNGGFKTIVKKIKKGDILWFLTSKSHGGKFIGMAEYKCFYDRQDEPLLSIHTLTNRDQNWKGEDAWDIQIHYTNLYDTETQNIGACIQCAGHILEYETFIDKIKDNLYEHYLDLIYNSQDKVTLTLDERLDLEKTSREVLL